MKNVINAVISTTCDVSANPYVPDAMPESGVKLKVK